MLTLSEALVPARLRAGAEEAETCNLRATARAIRTKGRYAAATGRGTKAAVLDTGMMTMNRLTQCSVSVRDRGGRRPRRAASVMS